jgi:hypothetical protein
MFIEQPTTQPTTRGEPTKIKYQTKLDQILNIKYQTTSL